MNTTITRIYSDALGHSHFEDQQIPLTHQGAIGFLSDPQAVHSIIFRTVAADYDYDFHTAPQKQFVILLDGGIEIETSLGHIRKFGTGEIILLEDTTGKGHRTRNLEKRPRKSLFLPID